MTIYFAASIRGGRDDHALYADIIKKLSAYGTVHTEHIGLSTLTAEGEQHLPDQEIFKRDLTWLKTADCVVAEVSTPSLGVGYELGQAQSMEKPILCLHRLQASAKLSGMIAGNIYWQVAEYKNIAELDAIFNKFFNAVQPLT